MFTVIFDKNLRRDGMFVLLDPEGKRMAVFEHMYDVVLFCERNGIEYVTK